MPYVQPINKQFAKATVLSYCMRLFFAKWTPCLSLVQRTPLKFQTSTP